MTQFPQQCAHVAGVYTEHARVEEVVSSACAVIRMRGNCGGSGPVVVCAQDKRAPNYGLFSELAAGKREKVNGSKHRCCFAPYGSNCKLASLFARGIATSLVLGTSSCSLLCLPPPLESLTTMKDFGKFGIMMVRSFAIR